MSPGLGATEKLANKMEQTELSTCKVMTHASDCLTNTNTNGNTNCYDTFTLVLTFMIGFFFRHATKRMQLLPVEFPWNRSAMAARQAHSTQHLGSSYYNK